MKRILVLVCLILFLGTYASAEYAAAADRFVNNKDGTITDTQTGLMWAAKDNGSEINWRDAQSYCENYRGGGYSDWRLPTQEELAGLYDAGKTYKSDCGYDVHLTELIRITCTAPWASETRGSKNALPLFYDATGYWIPRNLGVRSLRALPVRSGK
jgi:hypothetical protein